PPPLALARKYAIVVSFTLLFVTLALSSDAFLTSRNLLNVFDQSVSTGLIAIAGTYVIIAGGFDLSVGSIFAFTGVVAAMVALDHGTVLGLTAGVASGTALGAVNGALVTYGRINPFVTTLASEFMIRGWAFLLSAGLLIPVYEGGFDKLGRGIALGVRYPSWVFLIFAIVMGAVLAKTRYGRYVYACGANAEAARRAGINVSRIRLSTYALSGFAAGLAGILAASRVATGQPDTGAGLTLTAIAAVVIGGTSIMGGEGAVWRSVLGAILLTLIGNGFNLLGVNVAYQQILEGAIILQAVALDAWSKEKA
ncbi:MAG TPA: ABC transporter permease, partial [Actinomycetota bacterium]|nr:ABC transporter permease [Actinomycetota bacterium]